MSYVRSSIKSSAFLVERDQERCSDYATESSEDTSRFSTLAYSHRMFTGLHYVTRFKHFPSIRPDIDILPVRQASASRILCIIEDVVHDISDFVRDHPGGEAVLRNVAGKDVTTTFFGEAYKQRLSLLMHNPDIP
jgi:hypothetical protein